jgi:lysophospholipase L1-like esterase
MTEVVTTIFWKQILEKGFVYGIPFHFQGKFLQNIAYFDEKEDKKNLENGIINRFPQKLVKKFSYLKHLSINTSGVRIEFESFAKAISIDATFPKVGPMENMCELAQRGLEILVDGKVLTSIFSSKKSWKSQINIPSSEKSHRISLVFPLYAPCIIKSITFFGFKGKDPAPFKREPEYLKDERPIIYYGSSITQGGCTSRPSLAYPNILSESLGLNFINLGLSGSGCGEPEIAEYVSSIKNSSLFVLDWGANLLDPSHGTRLEDRYRNFWQKIHKENPSTPILFVNMLKNEREVLDPELVKPYIESKRRFIEKEANYAIEVIQKEKEAFDKLKGGDPNINPGNFGYIDGATIIGENNMDLMVDGSHPNDLGHKKIAELLEWKIIELLGN